MTPYNEDSFSASFESMSIGTQFSDSSNESNIFPPCDAPNPGCPLTTRQPAENLFVSYHETHA